MRRALAVLAWTALCACGGVPPLPEPFEAPGGGAVIRVPEAQPTIQAGVDAAAEGDVVLVAPGFYFEKVKIRDKRITVASWYLASQDPVHRNKTVVSSRGADFEVHGGRDGGGEVRVVGFTLRNSKYGVSAEAASVRVEHNRIYGNAEGGVQALNSRLTLVDNDIRDHGEGYGVSLTGASTLLAEDNRLDRNRFGVFVALHPYEGERLDVVVRRNRIVRSSEGGVVLVRHVLNSDRLVRIERNVFEHNRGPAVGCRERRANVGPLEGAELREPVFVVHNTFVANAFGVIGGDNLVAANNLFVKTVEVALLRLLDRSVTERNGFWANGRDGEDVPRTRRLRSADPLLDDDLRLGSGSPAIDAGLASLTHDGLTVLPVGPYDGEAPDLGAFER